MANEILRYCELIEETTYAQDPSPAAGNAKGIYLDITSTSLDLPNETDGITPSAFGRSARRKFAGWYSPSGDIAYQTNVRTIAAILKWAFGGYAFTAGAAATATAPQQLHTHESWGSDSRILPSFCARIGKDNFEHVFKGCVIDSLELEVEDELVSLTFSISSSVDQKAPLQLKSTVFAKLPAEREIPFHAVAVSIAGVVQQRKLKNLTLSVGNNADAESGRYLGSRFAGRIPVNERETTVSTEMDFTDLQQIERIWGGTAGPTSQGAVEFPLEVSLFGGKNANGLDQTVLLQLPRVFYTAVETQPDGRDEMTQPVEMRALTGDVTLLDGTTKVATDVYSRTKNEAAIVEAAAA